MGTRINQSVYGTVPTTSYSRAVCPNNIGTLYSAGNYDPTGDCEGGFEKSISPWGIGGGMACDIYVGNAQRSANGRFAKLNVDTPENYNKPVSFWDIRVTQGSQDNNKPQRYRIGGNVKYSSGNFVSNGSTENGLVLWGANASAKPIGKIEYNHTLLYPLLICLRANENYRSPLTTWRPLYFTDIDDDPEFINDIITDNVELVAFSWGCKMYNSNSGYPNAWHNENLSLINTKAQKVPEIYKAMSMRDSSDASKWYDNAILSLPNVIGSFTDAATMVQNTSCYSGHDYCKLASADFTTPVQQTYTRDGFGKCYGVGNTNKRVFDDISYHYEVRCFYYLNGVYREVLEGELILEQTMYYLPYFKIDETTYNTKWDSMKAIIRHELAYIGFPFIMDSDQSGNIGDNNVSVPVFDNHMITTGRYITGSAASQLPNAQWGDIFSDTMPEYDPNYVPPAPSPSLPDEDSGYLNQRTYHGYHMQGSNKYYALNESELIQLIAEINGLYADTSSTPDPSILDTLQKQVAVNFKGSNPADYIVGIYGYPFGIPHVATSSPVMIGPVGTSISASIVESQAVGAMTFGSITVPNVGNFLDYAPYSQIQLYLPMLGTVDLDPAFYMGHEVSVEYIYDINTGSLSGVVYRDDIIDKIIDGSLCAQVPVTARNMGDYQNNLHQMKMALVNSALSGAQNSLGLFTEGAKTVQGSMNGDSPLAGMSMSSVDIFAVPFNAGQGISNAIYAIEHSMPKLASTSTASSNNAMQFDFTPVLFIKRASMLPEYDSELYGHTVGFACCVNKVIGNMSGLTVATNIDTSNITTANGQALTADEINAIKQAFSNGVYV